MTQDAIKDFLLKTLHYTRFELEYARADSDAWLGHVAFGYMLVSEFRPNLLVELGTHWGNSYFSFCQAVRDQQLNTKCFAVDSWEGDPQAGFYDNAIFDTVSKQNAQYESFSTLKRMFFDDAVSSFDDESIDILHIDGFHSYEAVKHDFTAWIGKVRPGGIVFFHDTNEYQEGFGVNRFWDELCEQSTEYHLFRHSHGLGVWRKPGGGSLESTLLGYLLTPASPVSNIIDALFTVISERAFFRKKYLLEQKKAVTDRELAQQALREAQALALRQIEEERLRSTQALADVQKHIEEERERGATALHEAQALALRQLEEEQERGAAIRHQFEQKLNEEQNKSVYLFQEKTRLEREISGLFRSSSWRMTAPLRMLKRCLAGVPVGILLIPALFAVSSSLGELFRKFSEIRIEMRKLLEYPQDAANALASSCRLKRLFVLVPMNLALLIHRKGGISCVMNSGYRIFRQEGWQGIRRHLLRHSPVPQDIVSRPGGDPAKVLVVDYRIPKYDVSAGERATWGILMDMKALGYNVSFMPSNMYYDTEYAEQLKKKGIEVVTSCDGCYTPNDFIAQHGAEFGLFYLIRFDVAEEILSTIRQAAPKSSVFFHAPDVYFLRESREAELLHDEQRLKQAMETKERELDIMRRVDLTVVISENERKLLRKYLPDAPMGVFPGLYAPIVEEPAPFAIRKDIFFLGGFAHRPNVDAALWFSQEIWPLIHARLPEASFHIIGSEAPGKIKALGSIPGVVVDGFVKDLDPLLNSIRLGVAPLRFGAGIKGKVAMTFGSGVPCICTEIAAEGMGLKDGVHTFIANEPQAFADAVVKAYTDETVWTRMSVESREQVRRLFSEEANRHRLTSLLWEQDVLPITLWASHCAGLPPRPLPAMREDIDISIIIPVYNKWHLTRACINSILETCDGGITYEIILADDGSKDDTTKGDTIFPGVIIVRTPQNMGFLRNCNNAAKHARGRHILLLNNDTIVFPNWLSSLYELMESDEKAGLVGSKLIYPSGEIQEAGGVIWNDASALNYGHGDPYNSCGHCSFIREADYISGASILVRGRLWREMGGFDQRYKTAYCEDCDLAMEVRAHGLRVLYQPASTVIHFEHQSYADADAASQSELQKLNSHILYEKWKDVLARDHMPPDTVSHINICHACRSVLPSMLERRRDGHMRVLFLSPYPPKMIRTELLDTLKAQGQHVHFALLDSGLHDEEERAALREAWPCDMIYPYRQLPTQKDILEVPSWLKADTGKQILSICGEQQADIVLCPYLFQAEMLLYIPNNLLKVIELRGQMASPSGKDLELMRLADILIVDSNKEAKLINNALGKETAVVPDSDLQTLLSHPKLFFSR